MMHRGGIVVVAWLVACLAAAQAQAPAFNPAAWNAQYNYSTTKVPANIFLQGQDLVSNNAASSGSPLFPLNGFSVKLQCRSPANPFPDDNARRIPGACYYEQLADGAFLYWEKEAGESQRLNNCYCYALNRPSQNWCDPGTAHGAGIASPPQLNCQTLAAAVVADGGQQVTRAQVFGGSSSGGNGTGNGTAGNASSATSSAPSSSGGHYAAAFYRPQSSCNFRGCEADYHFMRLDSNGVWSQKMGAAPVTQLDANGALIRDPEAASLEGGYTQFCGYFKVNSNMAVASMGVPDLVGEQLQRWRDAGLSVQVANLGYTAGIDDTKQSASEQISEALQRIQQGRKLLGSWREGGEQRLPAGVLGAAEPAVADTTALQAARARQAAAAALDSRRLLRGQPVARGARR